MLNLSKQKCHCPQQGQYWNQNININIHKILMDSNVEIHMRMKNKNTKEDIKFTQQCKFEHPSV